MKILIVDEPDRMPENLRSLLPHGNGGSPSASQSGIFAALSLPQVMMSRLTRVFERDEHRGTHSEGKLPDFADLQLENAPELMASLLNNIGLAYLTNGRLKEAECFIQQALEIRLKLYGREHPQTALSINSLARVFRDDGRLDDALNRVHEALSIDTRIGGAESLAAAGDMAVLASIHFDRSELTEAEHAARSALRIFEEKLNGSDPWVPYLLDLLGRIHQWRGEYGKAADIYEQVQAVDERLYGRDHPIYAVRLHNYAVVLAARGDLHQAQKKYDVVISILEKASGKWHPNLIDALGSRGSLLIALREFVGARRDLEDAAKRNLKVRGADHPFIGYDHLSLGRLAFEENKLPEALDEFEQALTIFRAHLPAGHAYTAAALTWKGRILVQLERSLESEDLLIEAIGYWQAELGERSVEHAIASAVLARAWFLQGKELDRLEQILQTSLGIVTAVRGANDRTAQLIREWLAALGAKGT